MMFVTGETDRIVVPNSKRSTGTVLLPYSREALDPTNFRIWIRLEPDPL